MAEINNDNLNEIKEDINERSNKLNKIKEDIRDEFNKLYDKGFKDGWSQAVYILLNAKSYETVNNIKLTKKLSLADYIKMIEIKAGVGKEPNLPKKSILDVLRDLDKGFEKVSKKEDNDEKAD